MINNFPSQITGGEVAVEADLVVEVAVGLVAGAGVGVAVEAEDAVVGVAVEAEAVVEAEVAVGVVVEAAAEVGAEVEVIVGAGAGAEVEVAAVVTIEQRRDPVEMFYQIQRVKEWLVSMVAFFFSFCNGLFFTCIVLFIFVGEKETKRF